MIKGSESICTASVHRIGSQSMNGPENNRIRAICYFLKARMMPNAVHAQPLISRNKARSDGSLPSAREILEPSAPSAYMPKTRRMTPMT
jgi:hypothetical protein